MKLKDKLAKDELPFFFKETEKAAKMNTFAIPPELLSEFLGKQGFYPFFLVFQKAYLAGFEKAREMATEVVSRNLGDYKHYTHEILPLLGEEEVS